MIDYLKRELDNILSIQINENEFLYKKILIMSLIDTLSKTISTNIKNNNRKRVTNLIIRYSNWTYNNHISLPHLLKLLDLTDDKNFSTLKDYCIDLYIEWKKKEDYLDKDPSYEDIIQLCPSKYINVNKSKIYLNYLTHVQLFYSNRNSLFHKFRELGYGIEYKTDDVPFYIPYFHKKKRTWELVYPLNFYISICRSIIENLEEYFKNKNVNPLTNFKFGTYWIEKLNSAF